jgi:hypothetical protein
MNRRKIKLRSLHLRTTHRFNSFVLYLIWHRVLIIQVNLRLRLNCFQTLLNIIFITMNILQQPIQLPRLLTKLLLYLHIGMHNKHIDLLVQSTVLSDKNIDKTTDVGNAVVLFSLITNLFRQFILISFVFLLNVHDWSTSFLMSVYHRQT